MTPSSAENWIRCGKRRKRNDVAETKSAGPCAILFKDMYNEMVGMIGTRHIQSDQAVVSIIREFNQKWNAVSNMFEKKYGVSPLVHNGFVNAARKHLGIEVAGNNS